jgi:hypothetical protein
LPEAQWDSLFFPLVPLYLCRFFNYAVTLLSNKKEKTMASFDTISSMENDKNKRKSEAGPVQAYAKLEGDDFCYYIRTLQVTLGRKVKNPESVDIPLGNTKSVSRQHARLYYNFSEQRFEMMIFGKNGAFINERFVEKGVTVPLENR